MDIAKTQPVVTIAGQPYHVHYRLSDLRLIEAEAAQPGRGLLEMMAGAYHEKVAIIWGGIRNSKNRGTKNIEEVFDLLDKHQEQGGNWHRDVYTPCCAAALFSGLGGDVSEHKVARILQYVRQASGDAEPDGGKGGAVPAAQ